MHESTPHQDGNISRNGQPAPTSRSSARAELWEEARMEAQSRRGHLVPPSREWFERLPAINRQLLGSGALCAGLGLFLLVGVPILSYGSSAVQTAAHPFTAAGKRESCLSNLQRVSAALAQYRSDYDDKLPVTEYGSKNNRKTWMAVLQERGIAPASFTCPTFGGSSDGTATGSYGFNPILAGVRGERLSEPEQILLVADRADLHDSILLPPFAGWSNLYGSQLEKFGNIESRHSGSAGITHALALYADGHADMVPHRDEMRQTASWGGQQVFAATLRRFEEQHPVLKKLATQSSPHSFTGQKGQLRQGVEQLRTLQQQCHAGNSDCETLEKRAWKGAEVLRSLGDGSIEKQMTADLNKHAQRLLSQVSGEWITYESELGFTLKHPANWKIEYEVNGRYHNTFLRSGSPHVSVLVEYGERTQPTTATTIDWTGMEQSLKKQYGNNYKRIAMGWDTLDGRLVSVWECEVKKPDGPRLRKRYLGYSTIWNSVIIVATAPTSGWKQWDEVWKKIQNRIDFSP